MGNANPFIARAVRLRVAAAAHCVEKSSLHRGAPHHRQIKRLIESSGMRWVGIYNRRPPGYLLAMQRMWWIFLLAVAAGCSNTLETGYKPVSLGASSSLRRSYYASPFTPEAQGANEDRDTELDARRPRPGY
jgi:hypothetical protein